MTDKRQQTQDIPVLRVTRPAIKPERDTVAIEEPFEIGLSYGSAEGQKTQVVAITMRTPGADSDLALGFLFNEGIIEELDQVSAIASGSENRIVISLGSLFRPDVTRLQRNFYMTSGCGVCGKTSIEALRTIGAHRVPAGPRRVDREVLMRLPEILSGSQAVFARTGGLHAAALFDFEGTLLQIREDVGRHNALDKLVGAALRGSNLPNSERILLLSGRISFELVQKAVRSQVPVLAAIGAPSSLAVDLAAEYNITTVGFLGRERFNVYSGSERIED